MKIIIPILGIIALALSGCSSAKVVHVDAEEFLQHAKVMDGMHSALSATYIGSTHIDPETGEKKGIFLLSEMDISESEEVDEVLANMEGFTEVTWKDKTCYYIQTVSEENTTCKSLLQNPSVLKGSNVERSQVKSLLPPGVQGNGDIRPLTFRP